MSRIIMLGATGSLGSHVLRQALADEHQVTVFVRTPARLPSDLGASLSVHVGDLGTVRTHELAQIVGGHDVLINCAGHVADGSAFVDLVDRLVTSIELLPRSEQPVCWFLAGAALLDIIPAGRRGVELPKVRSTYWPHQANFERLGRSGLDWRLLCPGPMVEQPALGLNRLRVAQDVLPVQVPPFAHVLPNWLLLPVFAHLIPEMIVPYADAAALMLANLNSGGTLTHRRVGLALPAGMRGNKSRWFRPNRGTWTDPAGDPGRCPTNSTSRQPSWRPVGSTAGWLSPSMPQIGVRAATPSRFPWPLLRHRASPPCISPWAPHLRSAASKRRPWP
jgi:hypothetical protein